MSTRAVAEAALRIAAGPLPGAADDRARQVLADTLAAQLAGTLTDVGRAACRAARLHPGRTPVPGTGLRTDPGWAAFAGAAAAGALDYDDGHYRGGGIHASSTVLPALLAAAPAGTPLPALRRALVAGYEVAVRAGRLTSPAVSGLPYRASGHAAVFGATAALAAVRGLGPARTESALRTAAAHAPDAAMTTGGAREATGWAAATAVGCADLAACGFGEPADASHLFPAGPTLFDRHTADPWVTGLGERYEILHGYLKPYPCCRAAHAMLDALRVLCPGTGTARITAVEVSTVAGAAALGVTAPRTLGQAQFALPWLAALLLVRGEDAPRGLRALGAPGGPALDDPAVRETARLVTLRHEPAFDDDPACSYPARVAVTTSDGRVRTATVTRARGSAGNPLSEAERTAKATELLHRVLPPSRTAALLTALEDDTTTTGRLTALTG